MKNTLIHDLVLSAKKHHNRTAVVSGDVTLTYEQLFETASHFSSEILKHTSCNRVAFLSKNKSYGYASILGILLAGKTYVPLNTEFPDARNLYILKEAEIDLVVIDPDLESKLKLPTEVSFISPNINTRENITIPNQLEDTVYILFTSGSSGNPKGVPISNANLIHYLKNAKKLFTPTKEDRFSQCFDLTFDLSAHDIFLTLLSGASLFPLSDSDRFLPHLFINKNKLTYWFSVPSIITSMNKLGLLTPASLPSLKTSLFCGETLSVSNATAWKKAASHSELYNLYGPTETTIAISSFKVTEDFLMQNHNQVPIGNVFHGNTFTIAPRPKGELILQGIQVAKGYLNSKDNIKAQFTSDANHTSYNTGDLVELDADGNLIFLGRTDTQIKLSGYRIELAEVEAVLNKHPDVQSSVALSYPFDQTPERIIACLQANKKAEESILLHCKKYLPLYMLPHHFFYFDKLPETQNGKINKNKIIEWVKNELL